MTNWPDSNCNISHALNIDGKFVVHAFCSEFIRPKAGNNAAMVEFERKKSEASFVLFAMRWVLESLGR